MTAIMELEAVRMRMSGASFRQIAEHYGVGVTRARQIVVAGKKKLRKLPTSQQIAAELAALN